MAEPTPPTDANGNSNDNDGSWRWALLVPILALLIPLAAITDASMSDLAPIMITVAIVGGVWFAGRNLLEHRHELRMREIEAEREVQALESRRLQDAQRLLDLDGRLDELRRTEPPTVQ